ncbi:uncharacterized protein LOC129278693 [Lytechinus pictus]|uniref:uncharacterized protein LOC129278693 n=1 Tax=Lytechinus pictus TaxID=7653 RepID=UPI0030B9E3BA
MRKESESPLQEKETASISELESASTSTTVERKGEEIFHDDHPQDCLIIPPKETKSQKIYFQKKWLTRYPWLHYQPEIQGVTCFECKRAEVMGILTLSKKRDPAFISDGFNNWKKATERFDGHQMSETHRFSVAQLKAQKNPSIDSQLNKQIKEQQDTARHSLVRIFSSMRYLLRQGMPFRRRNADEGNLEHLLKVWSDGDPQLNSYLKHTTKFTSPTSQEEIIQIIAHKVGREVVKNIGEHGIYGIMVDGTQDVSGMEQEAICFRHIDINFDVHESFVGLYNIPDTCSQTIANMIFDVMTRLQLNPQNLRAQTYDGAANMKGKYNGCQAKVKSKQPLALHFHCASHMANLVLEHAVTACQPIRDAIQWCNDLGVLFKRSGKYKVIFQEIASRPSELDQTSDEGCVPPVKKTIRTLCPTRWLCRLPAIISILDNYEAVVESLEEMATSSTTERTAQLRQMDCWIDFRREVLYWP